MTNLCLGGDGLAQKVFSSAPVPELLALYPVSWEKVKIERDPNTKRLTYKLDNGIPESKPLTREYIFHIPGLSLNGIQGLTPISYASKAIELGLTYESFNINFFKNGANTHLAVFHPKGMSDIAFNRFKEQFDKKTGVANANKPMYIESGTELKELTVKPADAELLTSKYFSIK